MHILLVSECEKKAIAKTNAILDSYAVRIGQRTWATPITMEALGELHSALRRVATRQTAVACWQNVANRRMRLLWVVGSRRKFAERGVFPVSNSRTKAETATTFPGWLRVVCLLAQASGLTHDLGKASQHFQHKLRLSPGKTEPDQVRHEWLSVCLLRALRQGKSWEEAWCTFSDEKDWTSILTEYQGKKQYSPANTDEALEYLVACHHKLFADAWGPQDTKIKNDSRAYKGIPSTNRSHIRCDSLPDEYRTPYGSLPKTCGETFDKLRDKLARLTAERQGKEATPFWWACLLLARAALIFADHTISAKEYPTIPAEQDCAANTCPGSDKSRLNQPLNWHLENVASTAAETAWRIGEMLSDNRDGTPLDGLQEMALEAVLRPADDASRFAWQNRAAATLEIWRKVNPDSPCLVFNLAGTGSGKTRMNLRAACLLSLQEQPRCSIALNLRSLTLQTGEALRADLGLQASDLATIIGDDVTKRLFEHSREAEDDEDNLPEEESVLCSGEAVLLPEWLEPFFRDERERTLLGAPVLVSTIDFLEAAGNPGRQGHHVKALLRLLSADLILDEIDGYEPESLVAVLRLIQLAALFGRNVICSSATFSQPVAEAVHAAWKSGRQLRQVLDGDKTPVSGIALIDDHLPPETIDNGETNQDFSQNYAKRLQNLTGILRQPFCPRRAFLQPVEPNIPGFYTAVQTAVERLHSETAWEYSPGKLVSFGLVRMANINAAIDTANRLATALPQARVACYHANDWRISRFHKEQRLDHLLTRKNGNHRLLEDEEIRRLVTQSSHAETIFIVVATPVEEIGRDHDFDWAVIEPSSAQSIVQTAGRVNRHRLADLGEFHNIAVLQYNIRHCRNCEDGKPETEAFIQPGYEAKGKVAAYKQHDLLHLLPWQDGELAISAALRFGKDCHFGQQDDRAICTRVTHYFGTDEEGDEGLFTRQTIDAYRMSATPYEETPLRDKNDRHETWRIQIDEDGEHWRYTRWDSDGKRMQFVENNREMTEEASPPNAWLWLSPGKMEHFCEQSGITPEEGMQAELAIFGSSENTDWIYNLGFGIRRRKI